MREVKDLSCKKTSIGGQALIEGIMMRGPKVTAMSVRNGDGEIITEEWPTNPNGKKKWYKSVPFVRGIFNMIETLAVGYKCLMRSADLSGSEMEEPTKFEKWLSEKTGKAVMDIIGIVAIVLGMALALFLFSVLPTTISSLLKRAVSSRTWLAVIEGIIKLFIFLIYIWSTSFISEMKRVYMYHGAEHKTIACYEAGEELTVENVKKHLRFHPRCGTSFIVITLIVSIIISSVITWNSYILRIVIKLLLLPVIIGISYELIKLAGKYSNIFTRIISAPGLWIQRLTTKEPDDSMIRVAIEAMQHVIPDDGSDLF